MKDQLDHSSSDLWEFKGRTRYESGTGWRKTRVTDASPTEQNEWVGVELS